MESNTLSFAGIMPRNQGVRLSSSFAKITAGISYPFPACYPEYNYATARKLPFGIVNALSLNVFSGIMRDMKVESDLAAAVLKMDCILDKSMVIESGITNCASISGSGKARITPLHTNSTMFIDGFFIPPGKYTNDTTAIEEMKERMMRNVSLCNYIADALPNFSPDVVKHMARFVARPRAPFPQGRAVMRLVDLPTELNRGTSYKWSSATAKPHIQHIEVLENGQLTLSQVGPALLHTDPDTPLDILVADDGILIIESLRGQKIINITALGRAQIWIKELTMSNLNVCVGEAAIVMFDTVKCYNCTIEAGSDSEVVYWPSKFQCEKSPLTIITHDLATITRCYKQGLSEI